MLEEGNSRIYLSHPKRRDFYGGRSLEEGLKDRFDQLMEEYCLLGLNINPKDIIFDIGANIGELGLALGTLPENYYSFEPDPLAFQALNLNHPNANNFPLAISDQNEYKPFYLASSTADSSLFTPKKYEHIVKIKCLKLDSIFIKLLRSKTIKLLKIEAEGWEPEVLLGSLETIRHCELIAIDAGPERDEKSTAPQVCNILYNNSFEMIDINLKRGSLLFRNLNFKS